MKIGQRIKLLRESLNISQNQLAKMTGIPRPLISQWEHGKQNPSAKHLAKLATALRVSVEALLTSGEIRKSDGQITFLLPIVMKVRAGEATPPSIVYEDYLEVSLEQAQNADAVIIVRGESMLPELYPGDYCGIKWQDHASHGDFVVALIDDFEDLTIKRFVDKGNYFVLESINHKFPSYSSKRHRIRILGKVTWVVRYYEHK